MSMLEYFLEQLCHSMVEDPAGAWWEAHLLGKQGFF